MEFGSEIYDICTAPLPSLPPRGVEALPSPPSPPPSVSHAVSGSVMKKVKLRFFIALPTGDAAGFASDVARFLQFAVAPICGEFHVSVCVCV